MANQTTLPDPPAPGGRIHDDRKPCAQLLRIVDAAALLEILPSQKSISMALVSLPEKQLPREQRCFGRRRWSAASSMRIADSYVITVIPVAPARSTSLDVSAPRRKAWRKYHKSECRAVRQIPRANQTTRALIRLLAMRKQETLSEQEWQALGYLQMHEGEWKAYFKDEANGQQRPPTFNDPDHDAVYAAETLIQPELGRREIYDLYYRVLTNEMIVESPLQPDIGATLDVFRIPYEPLLRSKRLRLLRRQPASCSLAEADPGRRRTHSVHFIDCRCNRCEEEKLRIDALGFQENFTFEDFYQAEKNLESVKNQFYKQHLGYSDINEVKAEISTLTSQIFTTQPWPDTLLPICHMKQILAHLSSKQTPPPTPTKPPSTPS
ncbi:hypothetical protein V493_07854, partial [Pseudogymnoascus sp. VKM F-4281 (FW-2241)]